MGSGSGIGKLPARLVGAGAVLHAGQIIVSSLVLNMCPVAGIHFPMSVVSMFMCMGYVLMRSRYRIEVVGAFVAPLALTSLLASRFVGGGTYVVDQAPKMKSA